MRKWENAEFTSDHFAHMQSMRLFWLSYEKITEVSPSGNKLKCFQGYCL